MVSQEFRYDAGDTLNPKKLQKDTLPNIFNDHKSNYNTLS